MSALITDLRQERRWLRAMSAQSGQIDGIPCPQGWDGVQREAEQLPLRAELRLLTREHGTTNPNLTRMIFPVMYRHLASLECQRTLAKARRLRLIQGDPDAAY